MSLNGSTLLFSWDIFSIGNSAIQQQSVVGDGVEFDFIGLLLDLSGNRITLSTNSVSYLWGMGFSGFVIRDVYDGIPAIGAVTFLSNHIGFDPTRVTFDEDAIFINMGMTSFTDGEQFSFRLEFAPTDLSLSNSKIQENQAGAVVGSISTTDLNNSNEFRYTVDDQRFVVLGGSLRLRDGEFLDFERASNVSVTVTVKDDANLRYSETINIEVSDAVDSFVGGRRDNKLIGTEGKDILRGRDGNDILYGLGGNDFLCSVGGNDRLVGGAGGDTYVFRTHSHRDVIQDFETGIDTIDISGWKEVSSFKKLEDKAENHRHDLWIDGGQGDVLIIRNFSAAELTDTDFSF